MATIRDVAKVAEVSVATVSRVLNNKGYVNEATKKKVLGVMNALDYKPNGVARSLYTKQTKTIGLIIPDITNAYYPEMVRAVEDVANQRGFMMKFGNSDAKPSKERNYINTIAENGADGIIVATNTLNHEQIRMIKKPVVVIDRYIHPEVPTVVVDNYHGASVATAHLIERKCKVIAHIRGPVHFVSANERCQGYLDVVQSESWFSPVYIVDGNYTIKEAYEVTKGLLAEYPEIDGIFAGNDLMAIGAMKAVREQGWRIPEDLALIGFDGIAMSEATYPELSTMIQPIYEIGQTAANLLIDLIEKKPDPKIFHRFGVTLEPRSSTNRM